MKFITTTEESFDADLKKHPKIVVDLWATWCSGCKALEQKLAGITDSKFDNIVIAKLDITNAEELASKLGIQSLPTLLFYKDGKLTQRISGNPERTMLTSELSALL